MTCRHLVVPLLLVLGAVLFFGVLRLVDPLAWLEGRPSGGALSTAVLLALATLVSEDLTCLAAGALVAEGRIAFLLAAGACFVGIFVGDVLLFLLGRWLGPSVLGRAPLAWFLDETKVASASRWLERRGALVILASRFLPGARLPTYFASGVLGTAPWRFVAWFAFAGLLWTPALVALAAGFGGGLERLAPLHRVGAWAGAWRIAGTLLLAWLALGLGKSLVTARGRALLRARWIRLRRFEYWPVGVFYLPVFALLARRALRGRGLDFTAANPALPHGGFVGESKRAIYVALERAGAPLPRMRFLPAALEVPQRRAEVRELQQSAGLDFPIVVKPDAGQRGEGVRIVRSAHALDAALCADEDLIVQEFIPGLEYGLTYALLPGESSGRLLSIARKLLPEVRGDGTGSLEELILAHPEHLPMARFFLARPPEELEYIPCVDERVRIGELGTHCRGARFHDGNALATPELLAELDRIVVGMSGFHLGRFDVRAASDDELRAGRFRILELNGVTSEPAHVYDPGYRLAGAWRDLVAHWRLAFEIGEQNAGAGARVSTARELIAALRGHRRLQRRRGRRGAGRNRDVPALAAGARR